MSDLNVIIPDI